MMCFLRKWQLNKSWRSCLQGDSWCELNFLFMMITRSFIMSLFVLACLCSYSQPEWMEKPYRSFDLLFTDADAVSKDEYANLVTRAVDSVEHFFGQRFLYSFKVFIHPGRRSLDSTWAHDWKQPGYKSECWMVASGVAERMDIISHERWVL